VSTLDVLFWLRAVDALTAAFEEAEDRLCALDGAIGDGDHGTSMLFGFREAQKSVRSAAAASCGDVFHGIGRAFLENVGGVTGVVFGSLFGSAGDSAAGAAALDTEGLHRAFASGLAAVKKRGRAAEGDKCMVDALSPAVEALRISAEKGEPAGAALAQAPQAAEAGMQATIPMEAKVGRGRYQAGKGSGHVDAGAASVCLIFRTIARVADASRDSM
jgi:dihydroxyacetone kinase-like protein